MTFRLSLAAILLASATAASAAVPTSTDEARALAVRLLPSSIRTAAASGVATTTDQARGIDAALATTALHGACAQACACHHG